MSSGGAASRSGVLGIADTTGRIFRDEEIRLAQAFADQAALALAHAQLLHELRERQARLEALLDVNRQLGELQPLEQLLETMARTCGRLLNSDAVGFRRLEGDELIATGTYGDAKDLSRKPRLKIGESLAGRVAATGRPLIVNDLEASSYQIPEHREAALRLGHRAFLGVPVMVGDRLAGVLAIRTRNPRGFSGDDVAIATAFAAQAAVALENTRLYASEQAARAEAEALGERYRNVVESSIQGMWPSRRKRHQVRQRGVRHHLRLRRPRAAGGPPRLGSGGASRRGPDTRVRRRPAAWGAGPLTVRVRGCSAGRPARVGGSARHRDIVGRRVRLPDDVPRRHRAPARQGASAGIAGAHPPDAEDGGSGPAGGRRCSRLQQPPHGDHRPHPAAATGSARSKPDALRPLTHPGDLRPRGGSHPPAPRVQPQAGAATEGRQHGGDRQRAGLHAPAPARRGHRPGHRSRRRDLADQGGSRTARASDREPRRERPRRDASRWAARHRDRARRSRRGGGGTTRWAAGWAARHPGGERFRVGMDEETRGRIFEPFFTTKEAGQGTGLGLATVYGIVQQHQGAIAVESAPGRGATFRIYLPMTTESLDAPDGEDPRALPRGRETVLLVEDAPGARALVRDVLEQVGYVVLEAANGDEAVEIARHYPQSIQLLLTDVIMPRMSGREVAERVTLDRPGLKVMYISGYTDNVLGPLALQAESRTILQKPFTPDTLIRAVREALDGHC